MYCEQLAYTFERIHPGMCIIYAVGDLGYARATRRGDARREANKTAEYAFSLSDAKNRLGVAGRGVATLWQARLGNNRFEYRLVKR